MKIEHKDKVTILLSALNERYNSIHLIRARVESTGVWAIGLSLGAGGWLLQNSGNVSRVRQILLILGVLFGLGALRFRYLEDLRKGFAGQQRVAARIEKALGLYEVALFDDQKESIYPEKWKDAGAPKSEGKFFQSTFLLVYLAGVFLCLSIIGAGYLKSTGTIF